MTAGRTEPAEADYVAADTDTQFDDPCGSCQDELQPSGRLVHEAGVRRRRLPEPRAVEVTEAGLSSTA